MLYGLTSPFAGSALEPTFISNSLVEWIFDNFQPQYFPDEIRPFFQELQSKVAVTEKNKKGRIKRRDKTFMGDDDAMRLASHIFPWSFTHLKKKWTFSDLSGSFPMLLDEKGMYELQSSFAIEIVDLPRTASHPEEYYWNKWTRDPTPIVFESSGSKRKGKGDPFATSGSKRARREEKSDLAHVLRGFVASQASSQDESALLQETDTLNHLLQNTVFVTQAQHYGLTPENRDKFNVLLGAKEREILDEWVFSDASLFVNDFQQQDAFLFWIYPLRHWARTITLHQCIDVMNWTKFFQFLAHECIHWTSFHIHSVGESADKWDKVAQQWRALPFCRIDTLSVEGNFMSKFPDGHKHFFTFLPRSLLDLTYHQNDVKEWATHHDLEILVEACPHLQRLEMDYYAVDVGSKKISSLETDHLAAFRQLVILNWKLAPETKMADHNIQAITRISTLTELTVINFVGNWDNKTWEAISNNLAKFNVLDLNGTVQTKISSATLQTLIQSAKERFILPTKWPWENDLFNSLISQDRPQLTHISISQGITPETFIDSTALQRFVHACPRLVVFPLIDFERAPGELKWLQSTLTSMAPLEEIHWCMPTWLNQDQLLDCLDRIRPLTSPLIAFSLYCSGHPVDDRLLQKLVIFPHLTRVVLNANFKKTFGITATGLLQATLTRPDIRWILQSVHEDDRSKLDISPEKIKLEWNF